jgi:hypothetical protein
MTLLLWTLVIILFQRHIGVYAMTSCPYRNKRSEEPINNSIITVICFPLTSDDLIDIDLYCIIYCSYGIVIILEYQPLIHFRFTPIIAHSSSILTANGLITI